MAALVAGVRRNPAKRARGRRVVLWMAGLFLATQGLAGYFLDHHGLRIRFPWAAVVLEDVKGAPAPTVLWMGTSRSDGGVRPDAINTALWKRFGRHRVNLFNAAGPVGDPYTNEYLLDAFLERGYRPEVVVVEVSPDLLARNSKWLRAHVDRQTGWSGVPALLPEVALGDTLPRLVLARLVPLYIHRVSIRGFALPPRAGSPPPLMSARGWAVDMRRWAHLEDYPEPPAPPELAGGRIDFDVGDLAGRLRDYRTDGVVSAALGRLLARCDAEGISVVVVFPAVSEVFREHYTPAVEGRFQDALARMREAHPFEVVDLRDSVPDAGFMDMDHLHRTTGALVYSRIALERVVLPAVERRGLPASR